ncbi:hypothetical protein DCC81_14025 [Chitinophaga parva]|uniref:FecR protein domain-containing protein n=1 Tax=Chitinophaga parva TaxID=2169414 RepID=A0A2T7BGJ4_9BACT|nr:FecR domain-containing protein [Chitinophaga parva]PUZ25406.1 hypothetical protein DCC81_14025 [Chitinophaga parva]
MMINDELITRFFHNQCTPEEASAVAAHLEEHPEVLETYVPEAEFLQMEAGDLPQTVSRLWLRNIHGQINRRRTPLIRRIAVAAIMAGIVVGGIYLLRTPQGPATQGTVARTTITAHNTRVVTNNTNHSLTLQLPDGSVAVLEPAAILRYEQLFADGRLVDLSGEADFTVIADKTRPFRVASGVIHTTVLGTFFHVKANPDEELITVKLHSGKVLVQAILDEKKLMDDAILTPGKALTFNTRTRQATLFNFERSGREAMVKAGSSGTPTTKPDWYQFNKQPMSQVLDQLSNYYGISIYYYPSDIADIYIDGKFDNTDSLAEILTDLTLPNNLKLTRKDDGFVIKRN